MNLCFVVAFETERSALEDSVAKVQADLKSYRLRARKLLEDKESEISNLQLKLKQVKHDDLLVLLD